MQTQFYVSHASENLGPWPLAEIVMRLGRLELLATDFIYDEATESWISLAEYEPVQSLIHASKPKTPPPGAKKKVLASEENTVVDQKALTPSSQVQVTNLNTSVAVPSAEIDESPEWFVQKETHRYGPFTYSGLIKALQDKSVFDFDFVWRQGMDNWMRISEHHLFTQEAIRTVFKKSSPFFEKVFVQRQSPRVPFESEVFVHDNRSLWRGKAYECSESGSGVVVDYSVLLPGQVVNVHFASTNRTPAFNALCEVVSKKFTEEIKEKNSPVRYGLKFVQLEEGTKSVLQEYLKTELEKAA